MKRALLFLALAGIGSAQQFGGGIMGPATASAPYWRGQYRCTMRTRIDAKGREWQHEECYWFSFGGVQTVDRESPAGPVATLHAPIDFAGGRRHPKGFASFLRDPWPARVAPANAGWWKRHLADTALHLAATSADAASSWGRVELNPVLRSADGRFGARGLGIKLGIFGAVELTKWALIKRGHRGRWVRSLSLAPATAFGAAAVRNGANQ